MLNAPAAVLKQNENRREGCRRSPTDAAVVLQDGDDQGGENRARRQLFREQETQDRSLIPQEL